MRKALLLSSGVAAALVLAVFVGAAAANTGAPVFYDARYPAPASTAPEGYEAGREGDGDPVTTEPTGEEDATDGTTPPGATPAPTVPTTPPATTPQPSAPATPPAATPRPRPTPTPTPDPDDPAIDEPDVPQTRDASPTPEEREAWLAFQQIVRECMADAGQEYLYWEWWNPGPDTSNRFPAMPADLTPGEAAAWNLALNGDALTGDAYRWEDAGCWGYAVHVTGGTH